MRFGTRIASGKEVLFVGHERGNSRPASDWLSPGRWKISISELENYLSRSLEQCDFGTSIERFVFCFEIADFELWGKSFSETAEYVSYRPKSKELWSVGQVRWSDVKDLEPAGQLAALQKAIHTAIARIGRKPRKPKDFQYDRFASEVAALLARAPINELIARPAT